MISWRYCRPVGVPVYKQSWLRVLFLFVAPILTNRVAAQTGSLSLSSGSGSPERKASATVRSLDAWELEKGR